MKDLILFLLLSLSLCLATANTDIDLDTTYSDLKFVTVKGMPTGSYAGRVVSNIGDFNGDGIDDMVINAANDFHSEEVFVIYGQKVDFPQDTIQVNSAFSEGFKINGPFINSVFISFGVSISKAIDLNGDGLSDIVIGVYGFNNNQGLVYVIYGKKGHTGDITINQDHSFPSSVRGFVLLGPQDSQFGFIVGSARDWNGDGFDDLLISAPGYDNSRGAVYVIYGKKEKYTSNIDLDTTPAGFTIYGSAGGACSLATAMDGVGDINGDGVDDILVGSRACFSVYGLYGKKKRVETSLTLDSSLDNSKGFVISSLTTSGQYATSISSAGDLNGDGIQDIILGSYQPASTRGVYVFYGRKANWASFEIDSGYASNEGFMLTDSRITSFISFGTAVSGGGDLNGDGLDDILVRARSRTGSGGGYVAVIYGSLTKFTGVIDTATYLTVDKGFFVSGLELRLTVTTNSVDTGDFNNDHIDDIIIGAPQGDYYNGKAYIVFGTNGCPRNCKTCESSSKCSICFPGYGLYESSCIECPEHCTECTSSSKCKVCAKGYSLSGSQSCVAESLTTISAGLSCSTEGKETQAAVYKGLFDGASAISNAVALGSSMPTNFGLVAKILRNTKYLNVSVSEDLQETFCAWKISTGIFPAPEDSEGSLPWVFERYKMKSAFLINYWKTLTIILLGLVFVIISKFAEFTFLKSSKIPRIVNLMASNFVLAQFYESIDEILFTFLIDNVQSYGSPSSALRICGFIFGLFLLLAGFVVIGLHGVILFKSQRSLGAGGKNSDVKGQFLKKYEKVKLFFSDFKESGVFQQAFLLINIFRSLLSSLIFTLLFRYPFLQIMLLIALNISILVYLSIKKPFKDVKNACAQYFCEGIISIVYLSILVLAILEESDSKAESSIKGFSMVIIICNALLLLGCAIFMIVKIVEILYKIYKESSVSKKAVRPLPNNSESSLTLSLLSAPHGAC